MSLKDLDDNFEKLLSIFPDAKQELVEEVGDKMYREVVNNIETSTNTKDGNLKNSVTKHVGSKGGYSAVRPDYEKAPHTHLLENGHKVVKDGKVVGWAPGKHMYRNALNKLADEIEEDAERMFSEIVGGIFD